MSLHFTRDFVSAVSLWHKRAVKKSYKKCRFTTYTRLRIATVLAHAYNYCSHAYNYRACDRLPVTENGAGLGARLVNGYAMIDCFIQYIYKYA